MIGHTDVCEVDFSFAMSVTRVHEDPRVTKPYADEQWAAIRDLGRRVDLDLAKADVRLTQGGEPTFVSVDDMEGPEWNYTALSPKKRELGRDAAAAPRRAVCKRSGFSIRDRENGIPASRFRAGPSARGGAPTGNRCGPIRL